MRQSPKFILFLFFFVPISALAQDGKACSGIGNNVARLTCYDELFRESDALNSVNTGLLASHWVFEQSVDDFTGVEDSVVYLESSAAGSIMTDAPVALIVRCDGNGNSEIYVRSGGYIGSTRNQVMVRYKFGDNEPISERWIESTDGKAAFLPSSFKDFRNGLETGQQFLFEITDFRGVRSHANFPSTSISDEFSYVLNGCNI